MNSKLLINTIYPIGSIYLSINSTNPSTLFGGTWERIAKGRTLVGVDENDNDGDFNTVSKTGGEKKHTLTVDEMPSHKHNLTWENNPYTRAAGIVPAAGGPNTSSATTASTGGDQPHNNLQPYYTCFIFVRTA